MTFIKSERSASYYASSEGGQAVYGVTTGLLTLPDSGESGLIALINPSGSGCNLFLHRVNKGASTPMIYQRYREKEGDLSALSGDLPIGNRSGNKRPSVAKAYRKFARTSSSIPKIDFHSVSYLETFEGSMVLEPGSAVVYTCTPQDQKLKADYQATTHIVWWELPVAALSTRG